MLSFKQQSVTQAPSDVSAHWSADEELDWLMNITGSDVDQQQSRDVSDNYQQTATPHTWTQSFVPVQQCFTNSSQNLPLYQFSEPQHPVPAIRSHQIPCSFFRGPNVTVKSQPYAPFTLISNPSGGFRKVINRKRKRTMFTTEQVEYLESIFSSKQYVTREERQVLVDQLHLSDSSIKVWFQNRRIRHKRDVMETYSESNSPSEFYESASPSLETIEFKLLQKADELGYVTLDESEMEVIVSAIDSVLSSDVSLDLEAKDSDQSTTESESSCSIYEPISPAASDSTDEEISNWEESIAPDQSLKKLFDLHFC